MSFIFARQCRSKMTKGGKEGLLFFVLSSLMEPEKKKQVEEAMLGAPKDLKGDIREGTASPSDSERKLQKEVDDLRMALGLGGDKRGGVGGISRVGRQRQ